MLESRALPGAVAQLGERRVRNAKVEGSIPFRSTIFPSNRPLPAQFTKPRWLRLSTTEGDSPNAFENSRLKWPMSLKPQTNATEVTVGVVLIPHRNS
jgi:hypothetical protein